MRTRSINTSFIITGLVVVFLFIVVFGLFRHVKASNNSIDNGHLVCDSVKIEKNDSLWSIATEYYSEEYESVEDYIEVIKETNNLKSDTIHCGGYLIVPHYIY